MILSGVTRTEESQISIILTDIPFQPCTLLSKSSGIINAYKIQSVLLYNGYKLELKIQREPKGVKQTENPSIVLSNGLIN